MKQALSPLLALVSMALLGPLTLVGAAHAQEGRLGKEGARIEEDQSFVSVVLEGFVLTPDGAPAEGAVVTSSAGGKAVADWAGRYRLETLVPLDAESIQVTAVGQSGGSASLLASKSVAMPGVRGIASVDPLLLTLSATCQPSWQPTFGQQPGFENNNLVNTWVSALAVFDDGSGPALYAGGYFNTAGGGAAYRLAMWNGSSWTAVGLGVGSLTSGIVNALTVFDDGDGPAIYIGGRFATAGGVMASNIVKWNGSSWAALGSGTGGLVNPNVDTVLALKVFDDGSGPALYAAGQFTTAGGVPANRIAKWDGTSWSALGLGVGSDVNDGVHALAVYDDGSGPALYAGGVFTTAGGVTANRIAKWDGMSWAALGSGMSGAGSTWVVALAVFDDGSGPALYAGGNFTTAGGVLATQIAKWNGSSWTALGSVTNGDVGALTGFDDGGGPALYAGGAFTTAGGVPASCVAKWNGSSWTALGSGVNGYVYSMTVFDDGNGPALCAAGDINAAGAVAVNKIARWDGSSWDAFGNGLTDSVLASTVFDDGGGPALHAGGAFHGSGDVIANRTAKWNGSSFEVLGTGMATDVLVMKVFDDGSGPALYVGKDGTTTTIDRWNGASWSSRGTFDGSVHAMAVFDDGSGPALYAGGGFNTAAGVTVNHVARWNGSSWSALGSGVDSLVRCLTVFDDGSGPALYAGGGFTSAVGGPAVNRIARWNGASWAALGSGLNSGVFSLTVFDGGSGPALYAGGNFTTAGGVAANRIARWNGSSWSALGSGMNAFVYALTAFDDGNGPALYAGGAFTTAGGGAANRIARWSGSGWTTLGGGMSGDVRSLTAFHDDYGPALYAGGSFRQALDSGDSFLAKWGYGPDTTAPDLELPTSVFAGDKLGSPPGEIVSFTITASDCQDSSPDVVCVPPSGSFFPRGTTLVTCTATDASGNQSVGSFPVVVLPKYQRNTAKIPD